MLPQNKEVNCSSIAAAAEQQETTVDRKMVLQGQRTKEILEGLVEHWQTSSLPHESFLPRLPRFDPDESIFSCVESVKNCVMNKKNNKLYWTIHGILWGKFILQNPGEKARALWPCISHVSAVGHATWRRESRRTFPSQMSFVVWTSMLLSVTLRN